MTRGATLIETLIYIALVSLMLGFLAVVFFQILSSEEQNRTRVAVEAEAQFIMEKIFWAATGARTINSPAANSTGTTLSVDRYNFSSNPVAFDLVSGVLRLSKGGGAASPLNSSNVLLDQVLFSHVPASGTRPAGVVINLTLLATSTAREIKASTTLTSTVYLRQ